MTRGLFSMAVAGTFALGVVFGACDAGDSGTANDQTLIAALVACHLYDGTVDKTAEIRACTPKEETHKTTICHIPPGNPANAHTLCIGNQAVPAHLQNHGDYLGPCKAEQPCPPPDTTGTGGSGTGGGTPAATGGQTGTAGAPATPTGNGIGGIG
jgi:hypothetical protein